STGTRAAPPAGSAGPSSGTFGGAQHVADAALGVDHRLTDHVHLAAQVRDVGLDDPHLAGPVVVPHVVQDLGLGDHAAGVQHQVPQQLELGGGQLDVHVPAVHLVGVLVQAQVAHHQRALHRGLRPAVGATQHRPDPRDDLLETERLGDVVVAADGEAG